MSQIAINETSGNLPGTVIETITGNDGIPESGVNHNFNFLTKNATVQFLGTAGTETLDFGLINLLLGSSGSSINSATDNTGFGFDALEHLTFGNFNTCIGAIAGAAITTDTGNTFVGAQAGLNTSGSSSNTAIGFLALSSFTTAAGELGDNTAIGSQSCESLLTGHHNICIGIVSGNNLIGSESSNILIGNLGVNGESNAIRFGTTGSSNYQINATYIAGINGVSVSNTQIVTMNSSTERMGTVAQIQVAQGGTGLATLTQYAIIIGEGTSNVGFVGPSATAGQILQSAGASANPVFSTATYPSTTTINQLLYSSSANVVAGLSTVNTATLITSSGGIPSLLAYAASSFMATNSSSVIAARKFSVKNQVFFASGTYTPTTGMLYCIVQCLGGGGAGGGAVATGAGAVSTAGGGGAGEYAVKVFSASTIGASQTVTIGAAGTANSGATGGNGGQTAFGALISANGGNGGTSSGSSTSATSAGGSGGSGSGAGADYDAPGAAGQPGIAAVAALITFSGQGANSLLGAGGQPNLFGSSAGNAGSGHGAGGSGGLNQASQAANLGGVGSIGAIIVTEYIIN